MLTPPLARRPPEEFTALRNQWIKCVGCLRLAPCPRADGADLELPAPCSLPAGTATASSSSTPSPRQRVRDVLNRRLSAGVLTAPSLLYPSSTEPSPPVRTRDCARPTPLQPTTAWPTCLSASSRSSASSGSTTRASCSSATSATGRTARCRSRPAPTWLSGWASRTSSRCAPRRADATDQGGTRGLTGAPSLPPRRRLPAATTTSKRRSTRSRGPCSRARTCRPSRRPAPAAARPSGGARSAADARYSSAPDRVSRAALSSSAWRSGRVRAALTLPPPHPSAPACDAHAPRLALSQPTDPLLPCTCAAAAALHHATLSSFPLLLDDDNFRPCLSLPPGRADLDRARNFHLKAPPPKLLRSLVAGSTPAPADPPPPPTAVVSPPSLPTDPLPHTPLPPGPCPSSTDSVPKSTLRCDVSPRPRAALVDGEGREVGHGHRGGRCRHEGGVGYSSAGKGYSRDGRGGGWAGGVRAAAATPASRRAGWPAVRT